MTTSLLPLRSALAVAATTLLALAGTVAPAAAANGEDRIAFGEMVDLAGAAWLAETETDSTILEIRIFDTAQRAEAGVVQPDGPGVILFFTHRETDPVTGVVTETNYEGFSGGAGADFRFDRSLGTASAELTLTLFGYTCTRDGGGPQGLVGSCVDLDTTTVDVDLDWTGVGPIDREVARSQVSDPPAFVFSGHMVQAVRDAQVTGTIAGPDVALVDGPASFAVLLRGKYHEQLIQPGS